MTSRDDEKAEKAKIFRRNMLRFRKEMGPATTQQEVADLAGLSVFSISRYEGGGGVADLDALLKLSKAFGRPVEDFFSPSPPAPKHARVGIVSYKKIGSISPELERDLEQLRKRHPGVVIERIAEEKKRQRRGKK